MKLTISYDPKKVKEAAQQLEAYHKSVATKRRELARRLAEFGKVSILEGFQNVQYDGNGTVSVDIKETKRGFHIRAQGQAVAFIEFGAGVTMGGGYPGDIPAGISPIGTYGKGLGANPNGWWFTGAEGSQHTYGNPPAAVMYYTAKNMRDYIAVIVKEVFASA